MSTTNRRDLLGQIATVTAATLLAAPAPAIAAGGVDPHLEWERELLRIDAFTHHSNPEWMALSEDAADAVLERYLDLRGRIFTQPPRTLPGAAAVIRAVVQFNENGCAPHEAEYATLRRVAALLDESADRRASA